MNTPEINRGPKWFEGLLGTTGLICLLLAFSFSLTSGISYTAALAQVTIFYHYAAVNLSILISS